jgi:eukaryotic-like serine/threonine-protein kinase
MTVETPTPNAPVLPTTVANQRHGVRLSWAYHEYWRQVEAGSAPQVAEYCAWFPSIADDLATLLSIDRCAHEDSHFTAPPNVRWPEPDEEIAGFKLQRELGRGAFSHVFLATEPAVGQRRVVVKIATGGADEALTLGRLEHPNIVRILSARVDQATGLSVVCMPFLGEATLCDVLERVLAAPALPRHAKTLLEAAAKGHQARPLAVLEAAAAQALGGASYVDGIRHLAIQLLDALAFIHAEGVCHRDLKPSNVLLTHAGVPMLLDFNLCGDIRRTTVGVGGTPVYAPPEQLRQLGQAQADDRELDGRSDLFSLGVILYELLTGRHPFGLAPGVKLAQAKILLLERQAAGAMPVRSLNPAVDPALAELVDRCLAFARTDRPASALAARALLDRPAAPARGRRLPLPSRRSLALLIVLPLVLSGGALQLMGVSVPAPAGTVYERPDDFMMGQEAFRLGNYQDARRHLDVHLRTHKDDARGWFQRGVISLKLKDYPVAVMDFTEAERRGWKADGLTMTCLGYAYKENKQLKEASYYLEQAVAAGYEKAEVLNNLGFLHLKAGALPKAEHALTRAIQLAPNLQAAYHNRGKVYCAQAVPRQPGPASGNADEQLLQLALSDFQRALEIGPPSGELHHDAALACVYLSQHDSSLAARAIGHLTFGMQYGLGREELTQAPFPQCLRANAEYQALRTHQRIAHPQTRAQRFLALP